MALESATLISDLVAANPAHSDPLSQADSHIRLLKSTLLATFPNINSVVTITDEMLNTLGAQIFPAIDGTAGNPGFRFGAEPALGFRRSAAGVITIEGGKISGDGAVPAGAVCEFVTSAVPTGWYRLNGQAISRTGVGAALFALMGTFYGAGDGSTTFNLPNFEQSGGLFSRASGSFAVQTDSIKSFVAPVSVSGADHTHGHTFAVGSVSYDVPIAKTGNATGFSGTGGQIWWSSAGGSVQSPSFTGAINNSGALAMSGTATYTGGTETRPVSLGIIKCIKA